MPIVLFAAAGACIGLGIGGGRYLNDLARRRAARDLQQQEIQDQHDLLVRKMDYERLRREAVALGLDPDVVEGGYRALVDGQVTVGEAIAELHRMAAR